MGSRSHLSILVLTGMGFALLCGAPDVDAQNIYWTDFYNGRIQTAPQDGGPVQDVVTGFGNLWGFAIDESGGHIYWTDQLPPRIWRADLDGSGQQILVSGFQYDGITAIRLDLGAGKMYWTTQLDNNIQRANLDGSNIEDLLTGLAQPTALALDLAAGKFYFSERDGQGEISRANLDGSNVERVVPRVIANDLAIAGGKLYWTEPVDNVIQRSNLDGSSVEDLITTGLNLPSGLVLDTAAGKMYYTNFNGNSIHRANLDGTNVEDLITTGIESPAGILLGPAYVPPTPTDIVYVDFAAPEGGTGAVNAPWNTLADALSTVEPGGTIRINGNSSVVNSTETLVIDQQVRVRASPAGPSGVRIGGVSTRSVEIISTTGFTTRSGSARK